jgi:hypothetical protein
MCCNTSHLLRSFVTAPKCKVDLLPVVVTSVFKRVSCPGASLRTAEAGISWRMNAGRKLGSSCEKASRSQVEPHVPHWNPSQSATEELFLGDLAVCVVLFITWDSPHLQGDFRAKGHVLYVLIRTDACDGDHNRMWRKIWHLRAIAKKSLPRLYTNHTR